MAEGRAQALTEAVLQVFKARGLPLSEALPGRLAELEGVSAAVLMQTALQCRGERDFLRLLSDRGRIQESEAGASASCRARRTARS